MGVYSFINIQAAIVGPGGAFSLGYGNGNADEGITTAMLEEKDLATFGADGDLMHSLRASNGGRLTLRYLKTAPINAKLSALYNFQRLSSNLWGQNVITINDTIRGDVITLDTGAFMKQPDLAYAKDGNIVEWEFVGNLNELLGTGKPII